MGNSGSRRPDNGYGPVHAMDAVPDLAWATTAARVLKWAAAAMVRATVRGRVTAVFMVMISLMTAATARVLMCAAPSPYGLRPGTGWMRLWTRRGQRHARRSSLTVVGCNSAAYCAACQLRRIAIVVLCSRHQSSGQR